MPIILELGMNPQILPAELSVLTPYEHCELSEIDIDENDEVLLITWNPNDKIISPINHDMKWDTMIVKYLKHIRRCSDKYCIQPEISIQNRLHCHGWIVVKDKIKWLKGVYPKLWKAGKLKVNKMKYMKALDYYKKDTNITENMLRYPFPYSHYTWEVYMYEIRKTIISKLAKTQVKNVDITTFFDFDV